MTRRNFLQVISGTLSAGLAALYRLTKKTVPRKFTRAARYKNYPGHIGNHNDINNVGKWSG